MSKNVRICMAALLVSLLSATLVWAQKWETDFKKAGEASEASNRYMVLNFSGSDWCSWCVKLDEEVFSNKAFKKYAEENLVLVLLDFPRNVRLSASLKEQNEKLARQYGVRGFPTILVLSPSGELVATTGYQPGGPENYVQHLDGFIDAHRRKHGIAAPKAATGRKARKGETTASTYRKTK